MVMELEDELGHYGNTSDGEWEEDNIEEYVTTDTGTDPHSVFITVCCAFIFIISIVGNIVVLLIRTSRVYHLLDRIKLLITISNLIFTLTLPFWAAVSNGNWVMGKVSCKLLTGMYCIGLYSCIYFQTYLAYHTFGLILYTPRTYSIRPCVIIWVGIAIFSILEMLVSDVVHVGGRVHCIQSYHEYLPTYVAHYVKIAVFFFVPMVVITFCYVSIYIFIKRRLKRRFIGTDEVKRKTKLIIVTMFPIVLVFIFWTPHNIFLLLFSLTQHGVMSTESFQKVANKWTHTVCHTLVFFHCCMDAFYQLFIQRTNRRIRERIYRRIHFRKKIWQRQSAEPRPCEGSDPAHPQEREDLNPNIQMQKLNHEPLNQTTESPDPDHQLQDLDHEPQNQTLGESPGSNLQLQDLDHEPQNQTLAESPDAGIRP